MYISGAVFYPIVRSERLGVSNEASHARTNVPRASINLWLIYDRVVKRALSPFPAFKGHSAVRAFVRDGGNVSQKGELCVRSRFYPVY